MMQSPYVVVDWGVIRALPKATLIPDGWQLLLPDVILHEITDIHPPKKLTDVKPHEYAAAFYHKFVAFLDAHRPRVSGADYWVLVATKYEKDFSRRARLVHVIDHSRTRALRKAGLGKTDIAHFIAKWRGGPHYAAYKAEQHKFVAFCDECVRHIEAERRGRDDAAQRKWIQAPDLVARLITTPGKVSSGLPRMKVSHVTGFPDRWAVARATRIKMWYALQRWVQGRTPSTDFENNFDDAQYLFLASYAGAIATLDPGLKRAAEVLFPGCRTLDFGLARNAG